MSVALFPHSGGLRFTPTGFLPFKSVTNRIDGAICFGRLHSPSWASIRCEGNRRGRPQKKITSDKTVNEDEQLKTPVSNGGTSSREEILALFRRIQSSISKGGLKVSKKRNPADLKEKKSAESVLGTLKKYGTTKQGKAPNKEENEAPSHIQSAANDKIIEDAPLSLYNRGKMPEDAPFPEGFTVPRPKSNFMKRSPIQPPTVKENIVEVVETQLPTEEGLELQQINEMKLSELKSLAKTKGVKGYSKLKKGELLEVKGLFSSS